MELIKLKQFSILDKHELTLKGSISARQMMEAGFHDASVLTIQARKAQEYLTAFLTELEGDTRAEIKGEDLEVYGATLSLGSTGDRYDYEQDTEYCRIKKQLAERAKWLKMASTSKDEVVIDGAIVQPVPIKTPSRETLRIKL